MPSLFLVQKNLQKNCLFWIFPSKNAFASKHLKEGMKRRQYSNTRRLFDTLAAYFCSKQVKVRMTENAYFCFCALSNFPEFRPFASQAAGRKRL